MSTKKKLKNSPIHLQQLSSQAIEFYTILFLKKKKIYQAGLIRLIKVQYHSNIQMKNISNYNLHPKVWGNFDLPPTVSQFKSTHLLLHSIWV